MILQIQLLLLMFSIIFGILFALSSDFLFKKIEFLKKIWKYLIVISYAFFVSLIYFMFLLKINNGALHFYSFFCLIGAYIITHIIVNTPYK